MRRLIILTALALSLLLSLPIIVQAGSIVGSKHDLGAGADKEPCAFCHTPHGGDAAIAPLWNRQVPNPTSFTMYSSPTMDAALPGRPNNISLACMSCHDGVNTDPDTNMNAGEGVLNVPGSGGGYTYTGNCNTCHDVRSGNPALLTDKMFIGPDLSNDHPISISFPDTINDPYFNIPPDAQKGWNDVKLFNGKIECASCHNVHDPQYAPFLRKSNAGSALCQTCHIK